MSISPSSSKKILLVHQNFPGQFMHIASGLLSRGHDVRSLGIAKATVEGVTPYFYYPKRSSTPEIHPWLVDFESQIIRAEAAFLAAFEINASGFEPDLILAHHGWGDSLFLKGIWPKAKMVIYCEFYYHAVGADVAFDPEFESAARDLECKMEMKNLINNLHFDKADAGLCPTQWQKSTFPEPFRSKIKVIHEGIDTEQITPNLDAKISLNLPGGGQLSLKKGDEVITFVNRNLEPYRGYHIFMRSLPEILRQRPNAHVLIIGGDAHSYGPKAPEGRSWRDIFLDEVRNDIDLTRVHFLGQISHVDFLKVLQVSAAHVYLTYPFVLSWSLLEAMSLGCTIVASDTAPVREVIEQDKNGLLVDFFDPALLARTLISVLSEQAKYAHLGLAARKYAQEKYDLNTVCLPEQLRWLESFL